jgi:hypothetical protein
VIVAAADTAQRARRAGSTCGLGFISVGMQARMPGSAPFTSWCFRGAGRRARLLTAEMTFSSAERPRGGSSVLPWSLRPLACMTGARQSRSPVRRSSFPTGGNCGRYGRGSRGKSCKGCWPACLSPTPSFGRGPGGDRFRRPASFVCRSGPGSWADRSTRWADRANDAAKTAQRQGSGAGWRGRSPSDEAPRSRRSRRTSRIGP